MATGGLLQPLSVLEIALILAIAYQVFVRVLVQRKPPLLVSRSDLFVLLFILAAFISLAAALYQINNASDSIKAFLRLLEYFILYLIVSTNIPSWQAAKKLTICLVVCGSAVSVLAIVQYFAGPMTTTQLFPWGTWWNAYEPAETFRAYSFFFNPLYVSAYLLIVWPINLSLLIGESSRHWRTVYLMALLINGIGLFLNFSRSAIVGVAIILLIFTKERARFAIIGAIALLFTGLYVIPEQFRVRLFAENAESRESIFVRFDRYQEALNLYVEHPLVGVGYGNYQSHFTGGFSAAGDTGYSEISLTGINGYTRRERDDYRFTAENTFLQYAGEMGAPGFVAFAALCWHFLSLLWNLKKRYSASSSWIVGIFAGLLSFLAASMFTTLTAIEMNSMFWILLGISKALFLSRPNVAQANAGQTNVGKFVLSRAV